MILILDLDDTIFPAQTLDYSIFENAKNIIERFTLETYGYVESAKIIEEVKLIPFDIVARKHNFPEEIIDQFQKEIDSIDYQLDIRVFEDYHHLKNLNVEKYLVTAGFSRLQQAKINALNIASDFKEIFIDDPFDPNRKFKQQFFEHIQKSTHLPPDKIWVIGDNPVMELKAGKALDLNTVQRMNEFSEPSEYADHYIHSFEDLHAILIT